MRLPVPNACSAVVILLLAVNYFAPFADLDWTWQVRTGALIVESGSLRTPDTFSYTIADGTPVHDFEWLYEVILWAVWSVFGLGGLKFLKLVVILAPLVVVARQLRLEGVRWHGIALAMLAAILALASVWNLRPLYCTTLGLVLTASMLHNHCTGKRPLSWALPVVMLLWANLHPGVIAGQGLLAGAIAWEWLNRRLQWNEPLDVARLKRLTLIGGLALAATFLSPDPIERLRYPFKPELAHPIMRIFVEMLPTHLLFSKAPVEIALIYTIAALVLLTIVYRFRQYRMWELALLAGLTLLASFAFRSAMDWLLVMLMLGVPKLRDMLASVSRHSRWAGLLGVDRRVKKMLSTRWFDWQPAWPALALGALLTVSLIAPVARAMPRQNGDLWPVAALDHAERLGLSGRFFGPPDYGAYIGWRLGERGKVYADTRGFFFPPILLEDSHFLPQLGPDWRARLDRVTDEYQTDYFLLETTGARGALWHAIKDHAGTPLFLDEKSVLLTTAQVKLGVAAMNR